LSVTDQLFISEVDFKQLILKESNNHLYTLLIGKIENKMFLTQLCSNLGTKVKFKFQLFRVLNDIENVIIGFFVSNLRLQDGCPSFLSATSITRADRLRFMFENFVDVSECT